MVITIRQLDQMMGTAAPLGGPITIFFTVVKKVYQVWRFFRKTYTIYLNPSNQKNLTKGRLVRLFLGRSRPVRIAAQAVMIASRILDCAEKKRQLFEAGHDWIQTFRYSSLQREQDSSLCRRIVEITTVTFLVIKQTILLGLHLAELSLSFSIDTSTQAEAVDELFVNASNLFEKLITQKEILLLELETHKSLIGKVLRHTGLNIEAKNLIRDVSTAIDWAETGYQCAQEVAKVGGNILERGAFAIAHTVFGHQISSLA